MGIRYFHGGWASPASAGKQKVSAIAVYVGHHLGVPSAYGSGQGDRTGNGKETELYHH